MNNRVDLKPGIYEHETDEIIIAYGILSEIREFEDGGASGVELKLEDYHGNSVGVARFCGIINPAHKEDITRGLKTEALMRSSVEIQNDGSLKQIQRLKIWLTDSSSVEKDYSSYFIEKTDGRKSLISR